MLKRILLVVPLTMASAAIATAQTASLKNYYNQENKVGFKYPASWASGKGKWKVGDKELQMGGEEPEFTVLVDLATPESWVRGGVTQAEVSLKAATMDEATCKAMKIGNLNGSEGKPRTRKAGTLTFSYLETSDSGMGRSGETEFYRTFHDGKCYELAFYKYGAITRKTEPGEKVLDQQYTAILHSLYFK
jgi:hypothetical protein